MNRWGEQGISSALAMRLAAIIMWATTLKTTANQFNSNTPKCSRCNLRAPWYTDPLSISLNKCLLPRRSFKGTWTWCRSQIMGPRQILRVYTEECSRLKTKTCPTKPQMARLKLLVLSLTKCRKHKNHRNTSRIWMKKVRWQELDRHISSRIRREESGKGTSPEDNTNRIQIRPLVSGHSQETTRDQLQATAQSSCTIHPAEKPPFNSFEPQNWKIQIEANW